MHLFNTDTIAAFATASSSGAVALLRISGQNALDVLKKLTRWQVFEPRHATFVKVYDGEDILDTALATFFKAPKSYTGEDIAEITLHATPYIKSRVLEILSSLGVRPAQPGEFTMRAFLAGKMDLAQAQGVADIIASKNKSAHRAAINTLEGRLSGVFKNIRTELASLLAQIEVRIDDSDEEMPPLDNQYIASVLNALSLQTRNLAATYFAGRLVKNGIKVAIIGIPNSGKSSLLNTLLGYDRAIVSPVGGTTRDTIEASFDACGYEVTLTDTAGIREHALDPAEKEGIARSRRAVEAASIIIFVKDNTARDIGAQKELLEEVKRSGKKIITVINKADLLPSYKNCLCDVLTSCKTSLGIEDLKEKIVQAAGAGALQEDDIIITSAVHYDALLSAARELDAALKKALNIELAAEHIRRALVYLKELIGEVTPDDVLDIIFSKFCVGK